MGHRANSSTATVSRTKACVVDGNREARQMLANMAALTDMAPDTLQINSNPEKTRVNLDGERSFTMTRRVNTFPMVGDLPLF
jgi:hypothetical protein